MEEGLKEKERLDLGLQGRAEEILWGRSKKVSAAGETGRPLNFQTAGVGESAVSEKVKVRKAWNCSSVSDIHQALENLLNERGW